MKTEATPRPWYITITQLPDTSIDYHIKDANGNNLKDWITGNLLSFDNETAELIIRAVNHFDELVEALKGDLHFFKEELKDRLDFSDIETDFKTAALDERIKKFESLLTKVKKP